MTIPAEFRSDAFRLGCYAAAKHAGASDKEAIEFVHGLDVQALRETTFRLGAYQTAKQAGANDEQAAVLVEHAVKLANPVGAIVRGAAGAARGAARGGARGAARGAKAAPKAAPKGAPKGKPGAAPDPADVGFLGRVGNLVAGGLQRVGGPRALTPELLKQQKQLTKATGRGSRKALTDWQNATRGQGFAVGKGVEPGKGFLADAAGWARENPRVTGAAAIGAPLLAGTSFATGRATGGGGADEVKEKEQASVENQRLQQQMELMRLFMLMQGQRGGMGGF